MPIINVLKPFTFHEKLGDGKSTKTHRFNVGEYEVSDAIANNPWIAVDFADGHIETPQAALKRTAIAAEAADKAAKAAAQARANAEASMQRLQHVHAQGGGVGATSGLDTPIGAAAVPSAVPSIKADDPEMAEILNTPLNALTPEKLKELEAKKDEKETQVPTLKLKKQA